WNGGWVDEDNWDVIFYVYAAPVIVTPTTIALSITTFIPTVSTPRLVTPGTLALVLTTFIIEAIVVSDWVGLTLTRRNLDLSLESRDFSLGLNSRSFDLTLQRR
ncbi:hypothetical protein LCGC14_2801370, partial [marine sediment metagenome]